MARAAQTSTGLSRRAYLRQTLLAGSSLALPALRPGRGASGLLPDLPRPDKLKAPDTGVETSGRGSLRAHAEARGLLIGCAVNSRLLEAQPSYGRVIAEQFNCVVGEYAMKWQALRPTPSSFDFKDADALLSFAEAHHLKVRGHTLCWHEGLPDWFFGHVTRANAEQVLSEHITAVVGRYKGRIHSWDVVNEAVWPKDGRPDGLRVTPWLELLGPQYLEIAFRAAHAADPGAILTYNDFGVEYDTAEDIATRTALLALVDRLQSAGVPLAAVGLQSHLRTSELDRLGVGMGDLLKRLRKRGLEVYLTELDVDDDSLPDQDPAQEDREIAGVYHRYLDEVLKDPAVKALLLWGLADPQSWLQQDRMRTKHPGRAQRPLLLSVSEGVYSPKPAFYAVRASLDGAKRR